MAEKCLYLHTSIYNFFVEIRKKKVLCPRNNSNCSWSNKTVFDLHRGTIFMTLLLKTFTGSCCPPKHPRIFHSTNSQVQYSVYFSLHFVVPALNFQGCFEIICCFSWSLRSFAFWDTLGLCVFFLVLQAVWAFERGDIFSAGTSKYIFPFLVLCERLDLLPHHLVTLPELAVQRHLPKYSPQKERNDVLKCISVYWPYPCRPEGADCCDHSSCFSVRITKNLCHFRLSDISPGIGS